MRLFEVQLVRLILLETREKSSLLEGGDHCNVCILKGRLLTECLYSE